MLTSNNCAGQYCKFRSVLLALVERWQQFDEFRMFLFVLILSSPKISKSPVFGRPFITRFGLLETILCRVSMARERFLQLQNLNKINGTSWPKRNWPTDD